MEGKMPKDPYETLHMLLDLLSDKEEALAHQRKVSYMLARNTDALEKRLHVQQQGSSPDTDLKTNEKAPSGEMIEDALCDSKEDCKCPSSEDHSAELTDSP
ncbi:hypothetical protein AALO_G00068260 [Alosa alosa]|uniref:Uncharacterized protein n=2 Tax=Alosa alosa TaxID=278164 RepID=A0AAV6H1F1_9TELE|nr:hypothetical protein AALO_G00068260 [Alosa alosa]